MTNAKECYGCHQVKPLSDFHKRKSRKDGYTELCKPCKSEYSRQRYQTNLDVRIAVKEQAESARQRNREYVYNILQKSKCADCGDARWEVLEFDHVRGTKSYGISHMVISHFPLSKIQEELDKCEVRCANCHRLKTSRQFGWSRTSW